MVWPHWPYDMETLEIPFPEAKMNEFLEEATYEEAIASAELADRDHVGPIAEYNEGDSTVSKEIGGSRVMMHMPGSKMYDNFDVIRTIDVRQFKPKSETYVTVTHGEIIDEVLHAIDRFLVPAGIDITDQLCVLGKGRGLEGQVLGAKMFGLIGLGLHSDSVADDRTQCVIGMQNALDGSARVAVCVGNRVFVCDNLAFAGDQTFMHRHTKNAMNNLLISIQSIIRGAPERFTKDMELHNRLKNESCKFDRGLTILTDLASNDAFDNMRQFKAAIGHYRYPKFGVFANDDSLWSVYNAATWGVKANVSPLGVLSSTAIIDNYFRKEVNMELVGA